MADNFFRLLRILQLVPRAPKAPIDTSQIETILSNEGMPTTMRTLQRDLNTLEGMGFGLVCDASHGKPYRWRYTEKADAVLIPGLDPQSALALRIVELHLERMVPRSTLKALQPHLHAAKKALEGKPVARWLDKVRLISKSQPLIAPKVDGNVTGVVHEALLEGKQILASYRSKKNDGEAKAMVLHPLGFVHRDSVAYLVALVGEYTDPRLLTLHRFADATLSDTKARTLPGFDLDAFIEKGELSYRFGKDDISVELVFEKEAGGMLEETQLAKDQVLTRKADGHVVLQARIPDTQVLRSWILGFGPKVEVVKPKALRAAIGEAHAAAAKMYA